MSKLSQDIINLRSQGFTYDQIASQLNCSKGTIAYHCGKGQKQKYAKRRKKNRQKEHPYKRKIEAFSCLEYPKHKNKSSTIRKIIQLKIEGFHRMHKSIEYVKPNFTVEDVIEKFSENPICYLTGDKIDIYKPREYSFDHKIPRSRGGDNSIENLGICTKRANSAKTDMTPEEFINFCKKVIEHNS